MNGIRFDSALAATPDLRAGESKRSLAHVFQAMLQHAAQSISHGGRQALGGAARVPSGTRDSALEGMLGATISGQLAAAQAAASTKEALVSDQELDDEGMNLAQYLFARADAKSTDPTEAWLLRNHAGYIIMQFAGYQPAGLSPKEIVDRYLEVMKGGNWPTG